MSEGVSEEVREERREGEKVRGDLFVNLILIVRLLVN